MEECPVDFQAERKKSLLIVGGQVRGIDSPQRAAEERRGKRRGREAGRKSSRLFSAYSAVKSNSLTHY